MNHLNDIGIVNLVIWAFQNRVDNIHKTSGCGFMKRNISSKSQNFSIEAAKWEISQIYENI